MRMMFDIKKIVVMTDFPMGTDEIELYIDLPSPFPIGVGNDRLIMNFDIQKGKGLAYAKNNFISPILFIKNPVIEHINMETGEHKIIQTEE